MSSQQARALWLVDRQKLELRHEVLSQPGPEEVLVESMFSAVSRGTEALVFNGKVPDSEWQRMRAPHQAGEFPWPVKYGYANVGRVHEGPSDLVGRVVFCLYPHQDRFVVHRTQLLPVPNGVDDGRCVLAANLETALNALWDAPALIGDRVSVVGAGVVGCLLGFLVARQAGVSLELVDVNTGRQSVAEALGARFATPETASRDRDLVFHTSATEAGLGTALGLASNDAEVIELSWYGTRPVSLPLGAEFHAKRLKLCSSQVGTVSPRARARYGYKERLALALDLCRDPRLDILFEPDLPFAESAQRLPAALAAGSGTLCQRLRYG